MRVVVAAGLALMGLVGQVHAQPAIGETRIYATERIVIGGSSFGTTSPLQVIGLPTLAGTLVTADGSGNIGLAGNATAPGTLGVTGAFSANGNVTLGDASGDTINFSGRVNTTVLWTTDNNVDLGASGANRPRDFFLGRNAAIGGTLGVTGASTLAALSATTGTFSSTLGVTGAATFSNNTGAASFASRTTGWRVTTTGDADVRSLFVDNLAARTFTADLEQVIVGSQRVTKSSSTISQAFTCPALSGTSTLWVDDIPSAPNLRVFASGDAVSIRNFTRSDGDSDGNLDLSLSDCVGVVTSYADGTAGNDGQQSWTFTRNSGANGGGMTASTVVAVKTLALDYGTTGMGFAEVSAVDGSEGQNAPYYQLATWTTAPTAVNTSVRCRLGKLAGMWDYAAGGSIFGLACGDSAATNVTIDPTNGFRIRSGTTDKFKADTSGNLSLTGDLAMGTAGVIRSGATALDAGTGYYLSHNSGTPLFRIGTMSGSTLTKGIRWDGTNLKVQSDTVTVDENGIGVAVPASGITSANSYRWTNTAATGAGDLAWYTAGTGSHRASAIYNRTATTGWTSSFTINSLYEQSSVVEKQATLSLLSTPSAVSATLQAFNWSGTDYGEVSLTSTYLGISIDSVEKVRVTSTGLGILTASPSYPLHVSTSGGVSAGITSTTNNAGGGYASIYLGNASDGTAIGQDNAGDFVINVSNSADIVTNAAYWALKVGSTSRQVSIYEITTTGAKYPFVSNNGAIQAKSDGLNATVTCTAGSSVVIAVEYGIVKSVTGTGCS